MSALIAVTGGSGSGKTTFARRLQQRIGNEHANLLYQDSYYIDQSQQFDQDGGLVNFDHPNAIDFSLMAEHLQMLKANNEIKVPHYDFATHKRAIETTTMKASKVILIDGILVLSQESLRNLFDLCVFVECDEKIRYSRRLERDVKERGRTEEGVKAQFENHVKPMHDMFVETSQVYADIIISGEENFDQSLENLFQYLSKQKII